MQVRNAREQGWSWQAIADVLQVSRQAVHQKHSRDSVTERGTPQTSEETPMHTRFDTESRIAVAQAADIARELGHREVGPGHLLLGLLANPRGTAYAALRDHGLDSTPPATSSRTHHVDPEPEPDTDETADAADPRRYDEDREALQAIGIDLDRVREAVRANLGQDLADGWADAARARSPRPRPARSPAPATDHHDDTTSHEGRGRRGPRSRRGDGPRFSRELRGLLRDVRRSVAARPARRRRRDDRRDGVPGMTGARLLVALTRSDDPAVQAVLATLDRPRGPAEPRPRQRTTPAPPATTA